MRKSEKEKLTDKEERDLATSKEGANKGDQALGDSGMSMTKEQRAAVTLATGKLKGRRDALGLQSLEEGQPLSMDRVPSQPAPPPLEDAGPASGRP